MRNQNIKKDASGTSMLLSAFAFMLSALAMVAYFMFRPVSPPQAVKVVSTPANACDDNVDSPDVSELLALKAQLGDDWTLRCQDMLDDALYDIALDKAATGQFSTSFTRLCQIAERNGSEHFQEAQFLFNLWEQNRNTSGETQEIKPLLMSFFQSYDNPNENCPAARTILAKLEK